jgi:NADPH2:quinone reductase
VGALPDGTLVGFANPTPPHGALAERTVVPAGNVVPVPEGLDQVDVVALGSAMPAMSAATAAGLAPGETVLIQGATGVAGRLAVAVVRLLGAGRVVATGRDDGALREVAALGADTVINTAVPDDRLAHAFTEAGSYDVVLDFLWGRPTEILLRTLVPEEFAFAAPTRLVQLGASAGPAITLAADSVRTSGVEIYGAARGADATTMTDAYQRLVDWAREDALTLAVERAPLREIETAWQRTDLRGRRLVVVP